jgi:MFS family permease
MWRRFGLALGERVGVYAAATAVASPMLGISVDRLGRRPVLLACAVVQAVALRAFVLATGGGGRRALGLGLVAVGGTGLAVVLCGATTGRELGHGVSLD